MADKRRISNMDIAAKIRVWQHRGKKKRYRISISEIGVNRSGFAVLDGGRHS